jgi:hypothetical protein
VNVTVATVVLNAAADLALTLESILAQDHPDLEVLVLDGESWDETHDVLAFYGEAVRVETVADGGIFQAMNEAAARARGDFILFMNAGDRFHSAGALAALLRQMPRTADVVHGTHVLETDGREIFRPSRDFALQAELLRRGDIDGVWLERFPAHQATLTRTALLRELRYDTSIRVCADHDFLLRAHHGGARIAFVDEIVANYRAGGFSQRNAALLRLELNAVYRAFSEKPDAVDRLLLGDASPFLGMRSPFAGGFVAGITPPRTATPGFDTHEPHRLVLASGARIVAPSHASAGGVRISGINEAAAQVLRFLDGDTLLATVPLHRGAFHKTVAFAEKVAPGAVIDLVPLRATMLEGGTAAFALTGVEFEIERRTLALARGTPVETNATMDRALAGILGSGWWSLEPDHVWSAARGELRLASADGVDSLQLTVRGNPALKGQRLTVEVNGTPLQDVALGSSGDIVEVDLGRCWRPGGAVNTVALVPSVCSTVGADRRELGVALRAIELR